MGDPENILKTAMVINVLMIIVTISLCFIPIPFMAPVSIIAYIISFCVLNIKFTSDFVMAIYQSDNKQIQKTKAKYENSTNKITNPTDKVTDHLEKIIKKYQMRTRLLIECIDMLEQLVKSNTLMTESINNKIEEGRSLFDLSRYYQPCTTHSFTCYDK